MKKVFLALIFCIFSVPVWAEDNYCTSFDYYPPIMTFSSSYGELSYDFGKSVDEISQIADLDGHEGDRVSGLAVCPVASQIRQQTVVEKIWDRHCLFTYSLDIFFGFQDPVVYVGSEFGEDSCEFKHILRHERQHQAINILALDFFIPKIKETLEYELLGVEPREVFDEQDAERASEEMLAEYEAIIAKYANRLNEAKKNWQKLMDNQENYRKEHLVCLKRRDPTLHMYMTLEDESLDYTLDY